jgi:hypothetical protein
MVWRARVGWGTIYRPRQGTQAAAARTAGARLVAVGKDGYGLVMSWIGRTI